MIFSLLLNFSLTLFVTLVLELCRATLTVKVKSTMNFAPRTSLSSTFIPRIRSDLCVRSRSP